MCYQVISETLEKSKYAIHRGNRQKANELLRKFDELEHLKSKKLSAEDLHQPYYFANGFSHPKLRTYTNLAPLDPQFFSWGLIPSWVKTEADAKKIQNQTLNARVESIFEKPSFRDSAKKMRCLVYVDGFYEYHTQGKKKYPFKIAATNGEPLAMAGLWSTWQNNENGQIINSVSILTTHANALMAKIHNVPKDSEECRMPFILPKETQDEWLMEVNTENDKKQLLSLAQPLEDECLTAYPVAQLIGKEGVGNSITAVRKKEYADLEIHL